MTRTRRPPKRDRAVHQEGVTDLSTMPLWLDKYDVAKIYRVSHRTIERWVQEGTFTPMPWDRRPLRWSRQDVERDAQLPGSHHRGSNGHRLRAAKAGTAPARRPRRKVS
jgi:Helix-turn-helix domain